MSTRIVGRYTSADIKTDDYETGLEDQIRTFLDNPACTEPVVIMPDCHIGAGCCIGFTMKANTKIIPNLIGVDIGCGVTTQEVWFPTDPIKEWLLMMNKQIRSVVPVGFSLNQDEAKDHTKKTLIHMVNYYIEEWDKVSGNESIPFSLIEFDKLCGKIGTSPNKVWRSMGTLGGGNHFIELGKDIDKNKHFFTVHCGSRNFGLRIAKYHQAVAVEHIKKLTKVTMADVKSIRNSCISNGTSSQIDKMVKELRVERELFKTEKGLEYLEGNEAESYIRDMIVAQTFAELNRNTILENALCAMGVLSAGIYINTTHNYISTKDGIIRKGAIECYDNRVIIPFNMRDGLIIGHGKNNKEWNYSAPHGAGRLMSRTKANNDLTLDDFKSDMDGVVSTSVNQETIDESPRAYKDAETIKELIKDTVFIDYMVKPILNIKG